MQRSGTRDHGGKRLRGDHGVAAVEFAIMLPFLALLVCGVVDLGRWYSAWNETKNAAREGAIYAESHPNQQQAVLNTTCVDPNNVVARVKQELGDSATSSGFQVTTTPAVAACNPTSGGVTAGQTITVKVERTVKLFTPIMRNLVGNVKVTADVKATVQG